MLRNTLINGVRGIKPILCGGQSLRCLATAENSKLTTIEVDDKSGIATLSMNLPPVNTLTMDLMHDLIDSINQIESNKSRGLILTSSNDKVFSAGLDLNELLNPEVDRLRLFWTRFQDLWLALHLCGIPTAAAINGHAPAAGCVLATACEYRVMLPNLFIGIHATRFSFVISKWMMNSYQSVLPRRIVERALNQGKLFPTQEALDVGLIDEVSCSKEEALAKCATFIGTFEKANPLARTLTKRMCREPDVRDLLNDRAGDLKECVDYVTTPLFQEGLCAHLEGLKKRK
ncbi:enoyl-CoA delta isomerase 1, mitochondrial isoform X1 [Drosophila ficusphila]|uniref:enoyl-CoA delta isomerase 1, mitochondrial isoform X1 n=1 Tax=Drosophila ficusphila TaxID=30025 RepID=UPI0007E8785E|nr:enoyl-CoA delta isomerase 1, mitochondrial isoform X1 [Drosophila ficusphila]